MNEEPDLLQKPPMLNNRHRRLREYPKGDKKQTIVQRVCNLFSFMVVAQTEELDEIERMKQVEPCRVLLHYRHDLVGFVRQELKDDTGPTFYIDRPGHVVAEDLRSLAQYALWFYKCQEHPQVYVLNTKDKAVREEFWGMILEYRTHQQDLFLEEVYSPFGHLTKQVIQRGPQISLAGVIPPYVSDIMSREITSPNTLYVSLQHPLELTQTVRETFLARNHAYVRS